MGQKKKKRNSHKLHCKSEYHRDLGLDSFDLGQVSSDKFILVTFLDMTLISHKFVLGLTVISQKHLFNGFKVASPTNISSVHIMALQNAQPE